VAAGLDLVLLSIFYYLIDVKGYTRFAFPFKVIGMNSIAIYICVSGALSFFAIRDFFFKALVSVFPSDYQMLINAVLLVSIEWLFLYFLYKKDIFLKV
jgi:predicted acyltransferase